MNKCTFSERLASHVRLAILLSLIERPAAERMRLAILCVLSAAPAGTASESLVRDGLEDHGFRPTREEVAAQMGWLERSGLVAGQVSSGVKGATILDTGRDVAEGRVVVDGVAPLATPQWLQVNLADKSLVQPMAEIDVHLAWLRERGVIGGGPGIAITCKGLDVAAGRERIDGIKAPSAETIMRLAAHAATQRLRG